MSINESQHGGCRERDRPRRRRVESDLARAARCADKILIDVPADYHGRQDLWWLHFYGSVMEQVGPNEGLVETIEDFRRKAEEAAAGR